MERLLPSHSFFQPPPRTLTSRPHSRRVSQVGGGCPLDQTVAINSSDTSWIFSSIPPPLPPSLPKIDALPGSHIPARPPVPSHPRHPPPVHGSSASTRHIKLFFMPSYMSLHRIPTQLQLSLHFTTVHHIPVPLNATHHTSS